MTNSVLGLRQGTLAFADWSPDWPAAFDAEAARIKAALPNEVYLIEHIGSTAVPGLMSKPILDIGMASDDHETIAAALVGLGYIDRGERSGRLFIRLHDNDMRTHNLHLYQPGSREFTDQLALRDLLRTNSDLRDQYAAEKRRIYEESGGARKGYAEAKTDFIRQALRASPPVPEAT